MATVKAYFYTTSDADNVVGKNLSVIAQNIDVDLTDNCSRTNPTLYVRKESVPNISSVNYMYINLFDRYYYVDDINVTRNGMLYISGRVDPLKSFESGIRALSALIDRQENVYNDYIEDNLITPRIERTVSKKVIGNLGNSPSYAITCTGGGAGGNS